MTIEPTAIATETVHTELGELAVATYEAALAEYGDPEFAQLIASTLINERLIDQFVPRRDDIVRAA
jgi:hypothetical protein